MPDDQSPSVIEARRAARLKMMSGVGRRKTILTEAAGEASGDSYSSPKLGS